MMKRAATTFLSATRQSAAVDRLIFSRAFCAGSDRQTGTVKWFDRTKGWGFIVPSGEASINGPHQADVFVHYSEVSSRNVQTIFNTLTIPSAMKTAAIGPTFPHLAYRQMKICADFPLSRQKCRISQRKGRFISCTFTLFHE